MVPVEIKLHYDALRDLLEARYIELRKDHPTHGPGFTGAWDRARGELCKLHGWTVDDFYVEMDRRRAELG